jgi:hypothetical protein
LVDRSIFIYLLRIEPTRRKQERVVNRQFAEVQPRVLGALLTAASKGLARMKAGVTLAELPRMADFAEWVVACEEGLGLEPGQFLEAYKLNQKMANGLAIEASPVAQEIIAMLDACNEWEGTVGGLLTALNGRLTARQENPAKKHGWPRSAKGLRPKLNEMAPNLQRDGIEVVFGDRGKHGYPLKLWRTIKAPEKGREVHQVHQVHQANVSNGLGGEHTGEHTQTEQTEMFTAQSAATAGEHRGNGSAANVHPNVHPVNGSKQRPGELGELGEHHFPTTAPASAEDPNITPEGYVCPF